MTSRNLENEQTILVQIGLIKEEYKWRTKKSKVEYVVYRMYRSDAVEKKIYYYPW